MLCMGWNDVPLEWVLVNHGRQLRAEQWPLVPGHRQNRARQISLCRHQSASLKGGSTPWIPQYPVTVVRERRIPEQVRTDASTRCRLQTVLDDGDVEETEFRHVIRRKSKGDGGRTHGVPRCERMRNESGPHRYGTVSNMVTWVFLGRSPVQLVVLLRVPL